MTSTFHRLALLGALSFSLCSGVSALAQDRPGGPGAPGGPPPGARGGDHQKMFEDMQHRRQQRLHDLLQIKPEQEAAFTAYVTGLEQLRPARPAEPGRRDETRKPLTAPERLDRLAQRLGEAQQRAQKAAALTKTFYAVLSAEQRKAADDLLSARGEGMEGPGGGMRPGMMMKRGMMRGGPGFEGPPGR